MKSLIRKILKEETQQRSLSDVIFDDLVSTFNEEVLIYDWGPEYSNMIKAIKNIINNAAIPHIEDVYSLEYFENEDLIKPILDKFVRYLYNDDYPLVGDTIEMIEMDGEDPNPILPGTKGVVTRIESQVISGIPEEHLWINWENGRTLKVLLPHDKIKIIKRGESSRGVIERLELMEDKIDDFVDFVSDDFISLIKKYI